MKETLTSYSEPLHLLGLPSVIKIPTKIYELIRFSSVISSWPWMRATLHYRLHFLIQISPLWWPLVVSTHVMKIKSNFGDGNGIFTTPMACVDCSALHDNVVDIYVGDYHISIGKIRQLNGLRMRFISFWQTTDRRITEMVVNGKLWDECYCDRMHVRRCLLLNEDRQDFDFESDGLERKFVTKYSQSFVPGNHFISQ